MNQVSPRDLEQVSAYLDGQLSQADSTRLESRIQSDPELRSVYEGLRQSRAILRKLPQRRAPRNFRLTPKMAGIKPPLPRVFPFFRLASALAAILFFLGYGLNLSAPLAASTAAATSFSYGTGGGDPMAVEMAPAPTEAPAEATSAPKLAPQTNDLAATPTIEEVMTFQVSETEEPLQTDAANFDAYANRSLAAPQPIVLPIHPLWLFGLLGLAVVSGAGAFLVRVRTEQSWSKANAAGPVRLGSRDLLLMALAVAVVVLLTVAVYWMSTGFSSQFVTLSVDNVNPPITTAQQIPFTPGVDNYFSAADGQGLVTSIEFPASALGEATALYYIPVLDTVAPDQVTYFAEHAFTLLASPKSAQLQAPITIWVDYGENIGSAADENKLALYWWSGNEWLDAAATCAPVSAYSRLPEINQVSVPVCQFGTFLLVAP